MKMYSKENIIGIVETFLAQHFGFECIYLNYESLDELESICENYGVEVEHIESNR